MDQLCEACERDAAECVEPCDNPTEPYRVCAACLRRLHALALRPVEWYNLAKRHGWSQFHLHDDFYDEDGNASQPKEPVAQPEEFPAPTLKQASHDARKLLDYSLARWHLTRDVEAAWRTFTLPKVLAVLSEQIATTTNLELRARVLEVCASTLAESGAEFIRFVWGEYPGKVELRPLAQASASCLPFREGFERVVAALAEERVAKRRYSMLALGYFHTPKALDWIEKHIVEPITETWGDLAAASKLDWPRVERWLNQGRPLSRNDSVEHA